MFWRRIVGPTTFFDTGARQVCTVKVPRTNTPLHALVTLNDTAFVEAARVMAQRILEGPASARTADDAEVVPSTKAAAGEMSDPARLDSAFRLLTAHLPSAEEKKILLARLDTLRGQFRAEPAAARELASVGEAPRPESLDVVEHAAWTALCSLLMNLDEVLSKE